MSMNIKFLLRVAQLRLSQTRHGSIFSQFIGEFTVLLVETLCSSRPILPATLVRLGMARSLLNDTIDWIIILVLVRVRVRCEHLSAITSK